MKNNTALEHVVSIPPYPPGKPISEVAREFGLDPSSIIKLASNENPLGIGPKVRDVLVAGIADVPLYPDFHCHALIQALVGQTGIDATRILPGAGSSDLIMLAARGYLDDGRNMVIPQYSFASYEGAARSVGAEVRVVPSPDFKTDLSGLLGAIDENTGLLFLATPNNPTGYTLSPDEVKAFVQAVPEHVLLVIDEAYREYQDEDARIDASELLSLRENLLIIRTFSKIYGLAGLRVGYGLADEGIISILKRLQLPFSVGILAEQAAVAALADRSFTRKCAEMNRLEKNRVAAALDQHGFRYVPSEGNFLLIEVGEGSALCKQMLKRGIIIRPVDNYGLPAWVRMSIGLPEHNEQFLHHLTDLLPHGSATNPSTR